MIKYIMFTRDVLLAIHNLSELKSLANNAKIRFSLKNVNVILRYMKLYIYASFFFCLPPPTFFF